MLVFLGYGMISLSKNTQSVKTSNFRCVICFEISVRDSDKNIQQILGYTDLKPGRDCRTEKKERESCLEGLRIGVVVKNKMMHRP